MYNIAVCSAENILVLIFTTYPIFLYFSSKHTSYNMYSILVFFLISVVNILVLIRATNRFFCISVVNVLVLICTTYPFFSVFL